MENVIGHLFITTVLNYTKHILKMFILRLFITKLLIQTELIKRCRSYLFWPPSKVKVNKQSLLQIDEILVTLNITKNYSNVHISSGNELNLILYNLMPNLNLFFLWNASLKSFLKYDIDIAIDLSSCCAMLPCIYERKYLTINFNKINLNLSKKIDSNKTRRYIKRN